MTDTLTKVEALKAKLKEREQERTDAQIQIAKLTDQLEELDEKLVELTGCQDWDEAAVLYAQYEKELKELTCKLEAKLKEAGIET